MCFSLQSLREATGKAKGVKKIQKASLESATQK